MIYNLTHYDLDGVVSSIVLKQIVETEVKAIGYNKLLFEAKNFIKSHENIAITDLNFDNVLLDELYKSNNKVLYVDHHKTNYEIRNTNKIKVYINDKYCASANLLQYLKKKHNFSDEIKKLVYYANDYDMWLLKTKESQILNYIFWSRGFNSFLEMFKNGYSDSIVRSFEKLYDEQSRTIKRYIESSDKYEILNTGFKILMIYCDKYINDVTLVYPDYDYYFIISNPYKMSVRVKDGTSLKDGFEDISKLNEIETCGCHDYAGGINIKSIYDNDELLEIYDKIIDIIIEYGIPF